MLGEMIKKSIFAYKPDNSEIPFGFPLAWFPNPVPLESTPFKWTRTMSDGYDGPNGKYAKDVMPGKSTFLKCRNTLHALL
jgi:hypothetical protein